MGSKMEYTKNLEDINHIFTQNFKGISLLLIALLNIIIRLPVTAHEVGIDTFYLHSLASSISVLGKAGWIIHPASFFGVYPFSYPSAQPFILSGVSQALGISIEYSILLFSIFLGVFSLFSFYIFADEFFDNEIYSLIAAFLYSLSPNFIRFTYWDASSRGFFIAILPVVLWLFIKCGEKIRYKFAILLVSVAILSVSIHRTSWFLSVIAAAFVLSLFTTFTARVFHHFHFPNISLYRIFIVLDLSLALFLFQFTDMSFIGLQDYHSGFFGSGNDFLTILVNLLVDYSSKIGIAFVLSSIGILALSSKKKIYFRDQFMIFCFLLLLPLMGLYNYSPLIFAPIVIIVGTSGIFLIANTVLNHSRWNKILQCSFIFICILTSTILPIYMIDHWNVDDDIINSETVNSADFIKQKATGNVIANNGNLASMITGYSGVPTLPLGGTTVYNAPSNQLAYGFANPEDIQTRPITISEINPSMNYFYHLIAAPNARTEWINIVQNYYWDARPMLNSYNANLAIHTKGQNGYYYWKWLYSRLFLSLEGTGNVIYDNGIEEIYSIPEN
ncbi:hypothetical protein [Methanolobus sp. WCC4]|uniref:hypothetical protein n=1 Tax=Methanolobus sp. WCC4 TaxID=3125784 RepID=UPI0030F81208